MMLVVIESLAIASKNLDNMMDPFIDAVQIIQIDIANGYEYLAPELREYQHKYK
jgi:hypothetical protein